MPHIIAGDPYHVTQRAHINMIEGLGQRPSHDIHSSITLSVSVFQEAPVAGKVSIFSG
jgi:hypothetical protein